MQRLFPLRLLSRTSAAEGKVGHFPFVNFTVSSSILAISKTGNCDSMLSESPSIMTVLGSGGILMNMKCEIVSKMYNTIEFLRAKLNVKLLGTVFVPKCDQCATLKRKRSQIVRSTCRQVYLRQLSIRSCHQR